VDFDVRIARPEEAPAIRDLARAAYSKYVERIGKEPAPMLDDYSRLVAAGDVWVARVGEVLVGLLVMRAQDGHLLVENVAVAPDRQGEGLGRRLMAFAEEQAARRGLREVRLYTNEKMSENVSFYTDLGYEETGRGLDGGYRRVFMRKRIPRGRRG
jgi:ribosomal protein S18 acetylase RimI-like enzyme